MKRLALAVAILIALATSSRADFQAGIAALDRGDYATALQEFKPLAEKGHAKAQLALGHMYELGRGVPQDSAEAVKWYRKAAEQGHAAALYDLGLMYASGLGVPQDYADAAKWYRKAADKGFATAMLSLGFMYTAGQGVPQDLVSAWIWFDRAASRYPPGPNRNEAARARNRVAAKMTPEQIAEAQRLAQEWKPKKGGR